MTEAEIDIDQRLHVWRPPLLERILGGLLCPTFLGMGGIITAVSWRLLSLSDILTLLGCVIVGVLAGLYVAATSLSMTKDRLIVRNLGHRRTIPLREITAIRSGYYGTEILCREGKWWFGLAVQKPRFATWLGKRTRADAMAEVIVATARNQRERE